MNGFQEKMLDRIVDNDDKLSAWEQDFVESLQALPASVELSEKQNSVLTRINQKVK